MKSRRVFACYFEGRLRRTGLKATNAGSPEARAAAMTGAIGVRRFDDESANKTGSLL